MNQLAAVKTFSHVKPGDTDYTGEGLREFFLYRDLGIAKATGGQVICHLVKANPDCPPVDGTGWQAGDVVHQRPGITHYLYDYSEDMEYLEIVSPADFKTVEMPPATDKVPPVTPWT